MKRIQRGILILPSLLTAAALFSGFYCIIFVVAATIEKTGDFRPAVFAIILAAIFDSLDGRTARFMKAESEFGSHFDSIADMVSFGVAPAVLVYSAGLSKMGRWGWMAAFLYLACAAVRLARFNVLATKDSTSKKYFKGMPSPVAAGGLSVFVLIISNSESKFLIHWGVFILTIVIALLMVSNVRFRSFKDMQVKRQPIQWFLISVILILSIFAFQEIAMFAIFVLYLLSGLLEELILFRRRRKSDPKTRFLPFGDREEEVDP